MKKHEKNYTILKEFKDEISSGEIDIDYDIFGNLSNDNDFWDKFSEINKDIQHSIPDRSTSIKIDDIIKILENLKNKGSNYVNIDIDHDRNEYLFYGLNIRLATDDEIDLENKIIEENEKRKKKKEVLQDAEKSLQDYEIELKKDPSSTFYSGLIELTKKVIVELKKPQK